MPGPLSCPACRSSRTAPAFRVGAAAFERCRACRSLFELPQDAVAAAAARAAIYDGADYFVKHGAGVHGYTGDYLADRPFIEAKFDRVLGHLERYASPGRLLDVGAGPGFLVAVAAERAWEAVGIDLNRWATAYGRDELGLDLRDGPLEEQGFPDASFDAVTLMDVVEHVPDPDALLAEVARVLRPGGAVALLTPDAGAPVSRLVGRRWPEVQMPGEHPVLFSRRGLTEALARHGLLASGWHTVGKTSTVATLLGDLSGAAPSVGRRLQQAVADRPLGRRVIDLDPRTKVVVYARKVPKAEPEPVHAPARVAKRPEEMAAVDEAILEELGSLAEARRYAAWLFDTFAAHVPGARVLEVGAGIGTFTRRMLDAGATGVLAIEPDERCAAVLEATFAGQPAVEVDRGLLPDPPILAGEDRAFDLAVCQNVLEHIGDDVGALRTMARVVRPGGHVALVVPAGPSLFGPLDDAYGHWRRYDEASLAAAVRAAGLEVISMCPMNAPGVAAWWWKNRRPGARVGAGSLRAYEAVVAVWRPIEARLRPRLGLSLACVARRPATGH